jgi:hypothetical protein
MKQARFVAIEHCLFARWIREAKYTMAVLLLISVPLQRPKKWEKEERNEDKETYSGSLLGAHTIATLSGNIT